MRKESHYTLGTKIFTNTVGLVSYLLWDWLERRLQCFPRNSTGEWVLLEGTFNVSPPVQCSRVQWLKTAPRYCQMCKIKATPTSSRKAQKHLPLWMVLQSMVCSITNYFNHIFVGHLNCISLRVSLMAGREYGMDGVMGTVNVHNYS